MSRAAGAATSLEEGLSRPRIEGATVKIGAGMARGHPLKTPPGAGTRPTSDKVRAALFDSLQFDRPATGARVLDLFAGSGALGLEALSRGADFVALVEQAPKAFQSLQDNVQRISQACDGAVKLKRGDAAKLAGGWCAQHGPYDLILVDPPYAQWPDLWSTLASRFSPDRANGGLLAADGVLVLEFLKGTELTWRGPGQWQSRRERHYGDTTLAFWYGEDWASS